MLTHWFGEHGGVGVLGGLSRVLGTLLIGILIMLALTIVVALATANV